MWKSIAAAVNRFIMKSYEEASVERPKPTPPRTAPPPVAAAPVAPSITREELQRQFEQAVLLLQAGNAAGAAQLAQAAVDRAAAQPTAQVYAEAQFKQATILYAAGDLAGAEGACRAAVDVPAGSDVQRKERTTYQLHLGDILAHQERFDEAEAILRDGLAERGRWFGEQHVAYAVGLAALADVLLARGRAGEALEQIDRAVAIDRLTKHERWPADLALRAYAVKAAGELVAPALEAWGELAPAMRKALAQQCLRQAEHADPRLAQAVLAELLERFRLSDEGGARDVPLLVSVNVALANVARETGDHDVRVGACREMVALCAGLPDRAQLAMAQQALAMALDDAGRQDEVPAAFDAAAATAREVGQLALTSTVLRNYAAWADKAGWHEQADALYREAVHHGASSGDWATHGRSTVAYGTYLHRAGRVDEARRMLEEAVAHLPPNHPDAGAARGILETMGEQPGVVT